MGDVWTVAVSRRGQWMWGWQKDVGRLGPIPVSRQGRAEWGVRDSFPGSTPETKGEELICGSGLGTWMEMPIRLVFGFFDSLCTTSPSSR